MTWELGNSLMFYIFFLLSAYVHTTCKCHIYTKEPELGKSKCTALTAVERRASHMLLECLPTSLCIDH